MAKKYVYFFGAGAAEGNMKMKEILGGKGANLAEMAGIGLPVPPGFTISTGVCALYYKNREKIPGAVRLEVEKNDPELSFAERNWERVSKLSEDGIASDDERDVERLVELLPRRPFLPASDDVIRDAFVAAQHHRCDETEELLRLRGKRARLV